jgi:tRNA G46 methylase TrmB
MNSEVHRAARESYERHVDSYAQGRPDYPAEIDAWLRESLGLRAGVTVLELGAGTGKFTSASSRRVRR